MTKTVALLPELNRRGWAELIASQFEVDTVDAIEEGIARGQAMMRESITQTDQQLTKYASGYWAGLDHIANFINALDSSEMTVREVRSAIYSECLTARPKDVPEREEVERLQRENADLKQSVIAFAGPWAGEWAEMHELPKGHLHPHHYDLLERCGARMVDFTRSSLSSSSLSNG